MSIIVNTKKQQEIDISTIRESFNSNPAGFEKNHFVVYKRQNSNNLAQLTKITNKNYGFIDVFGFCCTPCFEGSNPILAIEKAINSGREVHIFSYKEDMIKFLKNNL